MKAWFKRRLFILLFLVTPMLFVGCDKDDEVGNLRDRNSQLQEERNAFQKENERLTIENNDQKNRLYLLGIGAFVCVILAFLFGCSMGAKARDAANEQKANEESSNE